MQSQIISRKVILLRNNTLSARSIINITMNFDLQVNRPSIAGFLSGLDNEPPVSTGPEFAAAFLQHGLDNDPAFQYAQPSEHQPTTWQELTSAYPTPTGDGRQL